MNKILMRILNKADESLKPPPKIKPSEWVEKHLVFPDGVLAGQPVKLFEFQKEVIDQVTNPHVTKIVIQSAAQLLKTSVLHQAAFYLMVNRPDNMMVTAQTSKMMTKIKTSKWDKVIDQVPVLNDIIAPKNSKTLTNSNDQLDLLNGASVYFGSMGTPTNLRSVTTKYIFLDEVSSAETTDEGNPIVLAEQRTTVFPDRKILISSTPTVPNDLIAQQYELSDQRRFFVPCPHCGEFHTLEWENIKFDWMIVANGTRRKADPSTAKLHCPKCDGVITDSQRIGMIKKGYWQATNPDVTDVVGYQVSRIYSPLATIKKIVTDFSDAHYNFDLMSFWNNTLGCTYEDEMNKQIEIPLLENLRDETISIKTIPDDVVGIFMGIDQQLSRLECTTIGITDNEKKIYVLDHRSFEAVDTTKLESPAYDDLARYAMQTFKTTTGRRVERFAAFIDAGNGNAVDTVARFCKKHSQRNRPVFTAIKGNGNTASPLFTKSKTGGRELEMLNVNEGKNYMARLIGQSVHENAGNFANNIYYSETLPDDYFIQVTAEKREFKNGGYIWVKRSKSNNDRNEATDTLNYALISVRWYLAKLGANPFMELRIYNSRLREEINKEETKPVLNAPAAPVAARPRVGSSWFKK
ncbi:terminase gpA endonuclease subunit [Cedecea lapagei]|uniref:terminase gpA endonuclease subunit n=1 Tax=Cedecea lapagei TaxID=158823 RepID=UPI002022FC61|nr:terminase gpA endonuclease subunit [Cedecea lapagei]